MTCAELKMNPFIAILLGQSEQPEWWEDVYSEYIGLRENKSASFVLSMIKEITHLNTKVFIISKCVEVLATVYSRDLVNELRLTGCRGKFDYSNKEQYSNDLKAAITYSKKYITLGQRKQKELEEYNKRHGGGVLQRKDFDIWSVTLGKFMGFRIDYDVVSVSEWCVMMNQYEKYCEISHAEQNNLIKK
jgi:hypothetical protein